MTDINLGPKYRHFVKLLKFTIQSGGLLVSSFPQRTKVNILNGFERFTFDTFL